MRTFQLFRRRAADARSRLAAGEAIGISHESLGDAGWLFEIEGELDLASADRLREALAGPIRDGAGGVVVDLAKCSFVDSSGLAVLLEAQKALEDSSRFVILAPDTQPRRLLRMTSVDTVLRVVEDRGEAEAALSGGDTHSRPAGITSDDEGVRAAP